MYEETAVGWRWRGVEKEIGHGPAFTFENRAFLCLGQRLTFLGRHKAAYCACVFDMSMRSTSLSAVGLLFESTAMSS